MELLLVIGLGTIYFIGILIITMLIQLISYKVFKFNLYKKLKYVLIEREVR